MLFSPNIITCRRVLFVMVMSAFMIHIVLRVNMPIAIVEMGNVNSTSTHFDWNEADKQEILGSFYWGFVLTQLPGGRLSETFGTRKTMGISMLLASILTLLMPVAASFHYYALMGARICLGLGLGVQWPSVAPLASRWIGTNDASKFMSTTAAGSLGAVIALSLCGYLIAYLGWESVFYVTGAIGILWSMLWFYLVYDFPEDHPRITEKEMEEIRKEIPVQKDFTSAKEVPWCKILTSLPVWALVLGINCLLFNFSFVFNEMPTYMHQILDYNIAENGLLSSLPHIARFLGACIAAYIIDKLIQSQKFSTIAIRKFFGAIIAMWGSSVIFVIQALYGNDSVVTIAIFTVAYGIEGIGVAATLANCLEISPVYSGTISGIAFALSNAVSYMVTKLVALFTKDKQDFTQWSYIFWILVGINTVTGAIFCICASDTIQSWNDQKTTRSKRTRSITSSQ